MSEHLLVVADTGPLIALAQADAVELLRAMYDGVVVPPAVARELAAGGVRIAADLLTLHPWIAVRAAVKAPDLLLVAELDPGEAEAITLAIELHARVLLDERKGRRIAQGTYALDVRGTVGVLTEARRRGLIPQLAPLLDRLVSAGTYLSPKLIEEALRAVGEKIP